MAVVQAHLEKGRQALADAHLLLENSRVEAALNRAYYAAFNVARAAVLSVGENPRTHAGVRTRFDYHFVRSGRIEVSTARILAVSETLRQQADYDALTVFDAQAAADLLSEVEGFVNCVAGLLEEPSF